MKKEASSQNSTGESGSNPPESDSPQSAPLKPEEVTEAREKLKRYRQFLISAKNGSPSEAKSEVTACDPGLENPCEDLVSSSRVDVTEERETIRVDRQKEFGKTKGLHSKFQESVRYSVHWHVIKHVLRVETVEDWNTGKRVRASVDHIGPPNTQMTWEGIARLAELCTRHAIPFERVAKMFVNSAGAFTSGQISRILSFAAEILLPVYLYLADALADARILSGDDSRTRVLQVERFLQGEEVTDTGSRDSLISKTQEVLGRFSQRADGKGLKKAINISALSGQEDSGDSRSHIYFFRTHVGSVGNITDRLLALRDSRRRKVWFQGDLASTNWPGTHWQTRFHIRIAGCSAHARRPFARYSDHDNELCDYMLKAFAMLSWLEKRIDREGRCSAKVLSLRRRHGQRIWNLIRKKAETVVHGGKWPPGSKMYDGCQYIICHFPQLTAYLEEPFIPPSNNLRERLLRGEKMLLVSCKFRQSERGRVVMDILRTVTMTCSAARVPVIPYLVWAFQNREDLQANPGNFTPYRYAKKLDQEKHALTLTG